MNKERLEYGYPYGLTCEQFLFGIERRWINHTNFSYYCNGLSPEEREKYSTHKMMKRMTD